MAEFTNHRSSLVKTVKQNVALSDNNGSRPLQGVLLAPVLAHDAPKEPASQLNVMGRYALDNTSSALRFHIGLYGQQPTEQSLEITATRKSANLLIC